MNEFERDNLSEQFADLTALLEDAAGLSVNGQSSRRSIALIKNDITQIQPLLLASAMILTSIERILGMEEEHPES